MSVVRGRPPGLAGGIRGASTGYCSSLSACPAPKSPTKARLSAVHMACLQEGLLPSLNRWHDHSASSSVSTARASQTAYKGRWYRDLAAGGLATLEFSGRRVEAYAVPEGDPRAIERASSEYLRKYRPS